RRNSSIPITGKINSWWRPLMRLRQASSNVTPLTEILRRARQAVDAESIPADDEEADVRGDECPNQLDEVRAQSSPLPKPTPARSAPERARAASPVERSAANNPANPALVHRRDEPRGPPIEPSCVRA